VYCKAKYGKILGQLIQTAPLTNKERVCEDKKIAEISID